MRFRYWMRTIVPALAVAALPLAVAHAQYEYDPVSITTGVTGHGKQVITVTAGATGAPYGFTMWWMTESQFAEYQNQWPATPVSGEGYVSFYDAPTLNTGDGAYTTFKLGANESIVIEIGDLFDETGVSGTVSDELAEGVGYVFCGYANGDGQWYTSSDLSGTGAGTTSTSDVNCTYTVGWFRNHTGQWPSFASLSLGSVGYTPSQVLSILQTQANGNGLIALAHQLSATKISVLMGADPSSVSSTIAQADALIGGLVVPPVGSGSLAPAQVASLTQTLDNYNNGIIGPGHCGVTASQPTTWGAIKAIYRH